MTLFDMGEPLGAYGRRSNPIAHNHDPAPSHEAARRLVESGRRAAHQRIVLEMVRRCPRRTAIELWAAATPPERAELKEPQEVRRRMTDLKAAGLVREAGQRRCEVRGTTQTTWEAVE
jgi:hypothetical protein